MSAIFSSETLSIVNKRFLAFIFTASHGEKMGLGFRELDDRLPITTRGSCYLAKEFPSVRAG